MGFNARSSRGSLGMSAFVVSNIAADLKMLTNNQRFIFGDNILPEPLASFKIDNIFEPDIGMPSVSNFEVRNSSLSGFRWTHTTTNTDTFGSFKLQSFINAESTGTDILLFNQDGTVVFNFPVSFPGFVVSGDVDINDYKIINLLDPVDPQDGATKAYVDSLIGGGTVTLSGAVTGSGNVDSTIVTTLTDIDTSQITDFTTAVSSFRLDEFALPTSNIDLNSNKIINLATPTLETDGANKGYVDAKTWNTSQITNYSTNTQTLIAAATISPSQLTNYPAASTTYLRGDGVWADSGTIQGSRVYGLMTMQNNSTATTITTALTYYKVLGTTIASNLNGLSSPVFNRLTHTNTNSVIACINVDFTAFHNGAGGDNMYFALYKNGLQLANTIIFTEGANNSPKSHSINTLVNMTTNDYIELWSSHSANGKQTTVQNLMFNYITT